MICPICKIEALRFGFSRDGRQRYRCAAHRRILTEPRADGRTGRVIESEKQRTLIQALTDGHSIRKASEMAGVAKGTAQKYMRELRAAGMNPLCGCGQPSGHKGWCAERYKNSPARQAFVRSHFSGVLAGQRRSVYIPRGRSKWEWKPLSEVWPFGNTDDPIIKAVNDFVPKSLPYDVRCDVCQDLCLALVGGIITTEDLERARGAGIRSFYRLFKSKWGPISIDKPKFEDGELLRESIADTTDFGGALLRALYAQEVAAMEARGAL